VDSGKPASRKGQILSDLHEEMGNPCIIAEGKGPSLVDPFIFVYLFEDPSCIFALFLLDGLPIGLLVFETSFQPGPGSF
jgi:hypothetical protein